MGGPHIQLGHSGKEGISCLCQETNRYSSVVQPVAHSLHRMSYPALEGKFTLEDATKAQREIREIALLFLVTRG
jgi:hypothetical protein